MGNNKCSMIKIVNKYIPFKGFSAMAIYPFLFIRKGAIMDIFTYNHERIHFAQQIECLLIAIPFAVLGNVIHLHWSWGFLLLQYYLIYLGNYIVNRIKYRNVRHKRHAYYRIVFEREAFENEKNTHYLQERKAFCWLKYFLK